MKCDSVTGVALRSDRLTVAERTVPLKILVIKLKDSREPLNTVQRTLQVRTMSRWVRSPAEDSEEQMQVNMSIHWLMTRAERMKNCGLTQLTLVSVVSLHKLTVTVVPLHPPVVSR